jgi:hypothetical protein
VVFLAGLAAGGALSGTAAGLLAALLPWTPSAGSAVVVAVIAVALAVHDLRAGTVELPQRRSLIPQEVFLRGHARGFLRFGVEFGSGTRTYVTSASPYILIALMLGVSASFTAVVAAGVAFGAGRSVAPLQAVFADEEHWSRDLGRTARLVERSGSALAAAVAVTVALSWTG